MMAIAGELLKSAGGQSALLLVYAENVRTITSQPDRSRVRIAST